MGAKGDRSRRPKRQRPDDGISLGHTGHSCSREYGRNRVAPHRSVAYCFAQGIETAF